MRVRLIIAVVLALGACTLSGCVLLGKKTTAQTPPAPKPAAVQPASSEPLSIPQTAAKLPPPQPVNPEALATVPEAQPLPAPPETTLPQRPRRPPAVVMTKPPETPPVPPPMAAEERPPRLQPLVTPEQQGRLLETINERTKRVKERLNQIKQHRQLTNQEGGIVKRINSFLDQSALATQRGDLIQADALTERAAILAEELPIER